MTTGTPTDTQQTQQPATAPAAEEAFDQPLLSEQQQALARQTFQTAVEPLRESFGKRLEQTTESLARRGAFFGGTGQEAFREQVLAPQLRAESRIAGEIATGLGRTAMEQAFAASEAAKARQSQRELAELGIEAQAREAQIGREFAAEQAELGRGFQAEQAGLSREFAAQESLLGRQLTQEEAQRQRDFVASQERLQQEFASQEAEIGRRFTAAEQAQQRQFAAEQAGFGREFQAQQQAIQNEFQSAFAADRENFQAQEALLGREFTAAENEAQRQFQEAFQQAGFDQQFSLADRAEQERRNDQVLNLALTGQLSGPDADEKIKEIFGDRIALTTDDELSLQRTAAAAGLSVDEYKEVREALGNAQVDLILGDEMQPVHQKNEAGRFLFTAPMNDINDINNRLPGALPQDGRFTDEDIKIAENKVSDIGNFPGNNIQAIANQEEARQVLERIKSNQRAYELEERVPNINNFIEDPARAQEFMLLMAREANAASVAQARAQAEAAQPTGGKKSHFCLEFYHRDLIDTSQLWRLTNNVIIGMFTRGDFVHWYMKNADKIAKVANSRNFSWASESHIVPQVLSVFKNGKRSNAENMYMRFCEKMYAQFNNDDIDPFKDSFYGFNPISRVIGTFKILSMKKTWTHLPIVLKQRFKSYVKRNTKLGVIANVI